jgi:hypothetical protein
MRTDLNSHVREYVSQQHVQQLTGSVPSVLMARGHSMDVRSVRSMAKELMKKDLMDVHSVHSMEKDRNMVKDLSMAGHSALNTASSVHNMASLSVRSMANHLMADLRASRKTGRVMTHRQSIL